MIIGSSFALELLWWWQADRLLRSLNVSRAARLLYSAFMAANVLCLLWVVAGRKLIGHPEDFLPRWVLAATFMWHLLILPLTLVAWLVVGTGRGIVALTRMPFNGVRKAGRPAPSTPPADRAAVGTTRRQFLGAAVVAAPPIVTAVATTLASEQLSSFRVRPMTLALQQLPPDLDGLTIAHVSDIHVGRFTYGNVLSRVVEATNDLRADLVLLTGDLINMELADLPGALDVVRRMDGRFGV